METGSDLEPLPRSPGTPLQVRFRAQLRSLRGPRGRPCRAAGRGLHDRVPAQARPARAGKEERSCWWGGELAALASDPLPLPCSVARDPTCGGSSLGRPPPWPRGSSSAGQATRPTGPTPPWCTAPSRGALGDGEGRGLCGCIVDVGRMITAPLAPPCSREIPMPPTYRSAPPPSPPASMAYPPPLASTRGSASAASASSMAMSSGRASPPPPSALPPPPSSAGSASTLPLVPSLKPLQQQQQQSTRQPSPPAVAAGRPATQTPSVALAGGAASVTPKPGASPSPQHAPAVAAAVAATQTPVAASAAAVGALSLGGSVQQSKGRVPVAAAATPAAAAAAAAAAATVAPAPPRQAETGALARQPRPLAAPLSPRAAASAAREQSLQPPPPMVPPTPRRAVAPSPPPATVAAASGVDDGAARRGPRQPHAVTSHEPPRRESPPSLPSGERPRPSPSASPTAASPAAASPAAAAAYAGGAPACIVLRRVTDATGRQGGFTVLAAPPAPPAQQPRKSPTEASVAGRKTKRSPSPDAPVSAPPSISPAPSGASPAATAAGVSSSPGVTAALHIPAVTPPGLRWGEPPPAAASFGLSPRDRAQMELRAHLELISAALSEQQQQQQLRPTSPRHRMHPSEAAAVRSPRQSPSATPRQALLPQPAAAKRGISAVDSKAHAPQPPAATSGVSAGDSKAQQPPSPAAPVSSFRSGFGSSVARLMQRAGLGALTGLPPQQQPLPRAVTVAAVQPASTRPNRQQLPPGTAVTPTPVTASSPGPAPLVGGAGQAAAGGGSAATSARSRHAAAARDAPSSHEPDIDH